MSLQDHTTLQPSLSRFHTTSQAEKLFASVVLLAFLGISIAGWILFPNTPRGTYALNDGDFIVWTATSIARWSFPTDLSPQNFLAGLGSLYYPALPWLNPGAMALLLPISLEAQHVVSYLIYSLEVIIAIAIFVRHLGARFYDGVFAGIAFCVFLSPPFSNYFLPLPNMSLAPLNAHLVALQLAMVIAYRNLGRTTTLKSIGWFSLLLVAGGVGLYSSMFGFLTFLPSIMLLALGTLFLCGSRTEFAWKTIAPLIAVAVLVFGFHLDRFLLDGAEVTARSTMFPQTGAQSRLEFLRMIFDRLVSFHPCSPLEGVANVYPCGQNRIDILNVLGPLAAVVTIIICSGYQRMFGIVLTLLSILGYICSALSTPPLLGRASVLLTPTFFVFALYAFYVSAIALVTWRFTSLIAQRIQRQSNPASANGLPTRRRGFTALAVLLLVAIPAALLFVPLGARKPSVVDALMSIETRTRFPLKDASRNEIIDILEKEVALKKGKPFGGVVVTHVAARGGQMRRDMGFDPQRYSQSLTSAARFYLATWYGNSFMWMDLWNFNIPTVEEYGQWVTGAMKVLTQTIMASPGDASHASYIDIYNIKPNILRTMGVRFIISDEELQDPCLTLRTEIRRPPNSAAIEPYTAWYQGIMSVKDPVPVRLYEVCEANTATYSPQKIRRVEIFADALKAMDAPAFDGKSEAVVFDAVDGPLVPATKTSYEIERGAAHFTATAPGKALVVLPLQYSRCLTLHDAAGTLRGSPRLIRVDGVLTGIVFDSDVDVSISFDFGLGAASSCRGEDAKDYRALKVLAE